MRFTPRGRRTHNETRLNITPMIDVVFLLLIFFIVTTTFIDPESSLDPLIKTTDAASAARYLEPQIVRVERLNNTPVYHLGELVISDQKSLTRTLSSLPREPGIFVQVTNDISVDFAVAALQAARDAGFEKVTYVPAE